MKLAASIITMSAIVLNPFSVQASEVKLSDIKCDKYLGLVVIPGSCKVVKKDESGNTQSKKQERFIGRRAMVRVNQAKCKELNGKFDVAKNVCLLK